MKPKPSKDVVREVAAEAGLSVAEDGIETPSHIPALAASAVSSGLRRDWPALAVLTTWALVFAGSATTGIHITGLVAASVANGAGIAQWLWRLEVHPVAAWTPGVVTIDRTLYVPRSYLGP